MKIIFGMTHSEAGGLVEIWNDVATGLGERGHDTGCFALYPKTDNSPSPPLWHHIASERPSSLFAAVRLVRRLMAYLKAERPDMVVTAMPLANVLLPLAATLAGVRTRLVISHHSPVETHSKWLDRLDGLTGRLDVVTSIVSVSKAVDASLQAKPLAYRRKCLVIGNALPRHIEVMIEGLRAKDIDTRITGPVIALGRLSYQKNYPLLIAAMAHAPKVRLEIVGAGEDEAALRGLAADLNVKDQVAFLGHMPRAQALARAARAAIFVQVSHYEGHSLALIEAARLGLPLIVSDVAVQVEGVTARDGTLCGQVVPLDDPQRLGAIMVELLQSPDQYAHWAQRARRLGLEASNAIMVDRYERLMGAGAAC